MMKRFISGIIISLLLIYILLVKVDFKSSFGLLRNIDLQFLLLCAIIYLLVIVLRTFRFLILLGNGGISFMNMMAVVSMYNFFNQVMPAKTGEGSYPILLNKATGISFSRGVASLLWARGYDFAAVIFLYLVFLSVSSHGWGQLALLLLITGAVAVLFVVFFKNADGVLVFGLKAVRRIAGILRLGHTTAEKLEASLERLVSDFKWIKTGAGSFRLIVCSLALWLLTFLMFFLFINHLDYRVDFLHAVLGSAGAVFINILPVNTLCSIGTLEAGWTAGYVFAGVSKEAAFASGVMMHGFVIFSGLALSIIGALVIRRSSKARKVHGHEK